MKKTTTLRPSHNTVTQKQIADELGVSRQLVSIVLNGGAYVSEEKRQRVQDAARRLGYDAHSNPEARAMIARRYSRRSSTGLIGCVYLSWSESAEAQLSYDTHLLRGIQQTAKQLGRDLLLLDAAPSAGWERVDGLLVHGPGARTLHDQLGVSIPIVSMMASMPGISGVTADDADGGRQATDYLLKLGHRRIAYLLYTKVGVPSVQERLRGYQDALRAGGVTPRKSWIGELVNYGSMQERGYRSMQDWLQSGWSKLGCTALLVQNDRAAIGAMTALREAGILVPQDLSVVGFDSTDECELTVPRLTSVQVPLEEIGARAAELLISQIESDQSVQPDAIVLPTRLQVRDSTAPPGRPEL